MSAFWPSGIAQLQWSFAFSLGDLVTVVAASATVYFAVMTHRIQKEQVEIANKIKDMDDYTLRCRMINCATDILIAYQDDKEPSDACLSYIANEFPKAQFLFTPDEQEIFRRIQSEKEFFNKHRQDNSEDNKKERKVQEMNFLLLRLLHYHKH